MKLDTEIKLRAEPELKEKIATLAAAKRTKPSDLIRQHLWALVDEEDRKSGKPIEPATTEDAG